MASERPPVSANPPPIPSSQSTTGNPTSNSIKKVTKADLFAKHQQVDPTKVGLIPVSSTNIYLDRLKGWAELVKRLIAFFENILMEEKRVAEGLALSVKTFATPILLRNEPVFESNETMQKFVKDIIEVQNKRSGEHISTANAIESETLPSLRDLLKEVVSKAFDTDREWSDLDNLLANNRERYVKLTRNLRLSIERQRILLGGDPDSPLNKARLSKFPKDVPRDPWVANLAVQRFIHSLQEAYPKTLQALVDQQSRMLVFETTLIQLLKPTLTSYFSRRSNKTSTVTTTGGMDPAAFLLKSLEKLDAGNDWALFLQRNKSTLVEPDAVEKGWATTVVSRPVKYEGQDHPRVGFVKEGTLQRNIPGILRSKGYKAGHYVLTVSGFLHGFPEEKKDTIVEVGSTIDVGHFALGDPEFSLYLPECTISMKGGDSKDPKEFSIKSSGGILSSEKLTLKADADDNTTFWHDLVTSLAVTPTPVSEPSPRSSLSSSNGPLSPIATTTSKPTETNLMFESGEEYSEFQSSTPVVESDPSSVLQNYHSTTSLTEADIGEDEEEELHPAVASMLRGKEVPQDLAALKSAIVSGEGTTNSWSGGPHLENAWDDVNPSWG